MTSVTSKVRQFVAADPLGQAPDPWADFREVEVIELSWSQTYRHTLGKYSRFFLALEEGRFLATRCPDCGRVWTPPRPACPNELAITQWVELTGRGRLVSYAVLNQAPASAPDLARPPYVLVYVRLDGADTLFMHWLRNVDTLEQVRPGARVRVIYPGGPVTHPLHLMAFELDDSE